MRTTDLNQILYKKEFEKRDLISLLGLEDPEQLNHLFKVANKERIKFCSDDIHLRAVIDVSNYCIQHCMYCEMREDNFNLRRYRLQPDEIIDAVKKISKLGIGTVVLHSGEDLEFDTDVLAYIIYSIKQSTDVAVTLSFGERGLDEYRAWKIAGADRYILKFETSNQKKFSKHKSGKGLSDRIQHLKYLKRLDYQIGSGNIIGLPNQNIEDLADDILLLKEMDIDTAIFDSFLPVQFTPYQNLPSGSYEMTMKTIAIARLVLKNVHITSNIIDIYNENSFDVLNCGVNVIMSSFTPLPYRTYSNLLPKKDAENDPFEKGKKIEKQMEAIGRQLSYSRGDSLKKTTSL